MHNAPRRFERPIPITVQRRLGAAEPITAQVIHSDLLPGIGSPVTVKLEFAGGAAVLQELVVDDSVIHYDNKQQPERATLFLRLAKEPVAPA